MRSSGSASGAASRADDDKPASGEQRLAAAQLVCELVRVEETLVNGPPRAVVEHALLHLVRNRAVAARGVDDDELVGHSTRFGEETHAVVLVEVPVEVSGDDAVEAPVGKRK